MANEMNETKKETEAVNIFHCLTFIHIVIVLVLDYQIMEKNISRLY